MDAAIFVLAASILAQGRLPDSPLPDDCVLTKERAYWVLPPQPVGPGQTDVLQWSPSGRYLLLVQSVPRVTPALIAGAMKGVQPAIEEAQVQAWDRTTNKLAELGRLPFGSGRTGFQFFPGTEVAVASFMEGTALPAGPEIREGTMLFDLKTGRSQKVYHAGSDEKWMRSARSFASPKLPKLLFLQTDVPISGFEPPRQKHFRVRLWTLDANGQVGDRLELGAGYGREVHWNEAGDLAAIMIQRYPEPERSVAETVYFNLRTGKLQPSPGQSAPPTPPALKEPLLSIRYQSAASNAGAASRTFRSAWVRSSEASEQPETMVAGQADLAELSPTLDAVAILNKGVVTVRMLAGIPKEVYLQARAAAERAKILSQGKQIGTALHMFAADHEDRLPSGEEFGRGELGKYLKDQGLGSGFVYTFGGGFLSEIPSPSDTVLGYIPGPGGYAWVHADGHVRWKTEPPKPPSS